MEQTMPMSTGWTELCVIDTSAHWIFYFGAMEVANYWTVPDEWTSNIPQRNISGWDNGKLIIDYKALI